MRPPSNKALKTLAALFASLTLLASTAGVASATNENAASQADVSHEEQLDEGAAEEEAPEDEQSGPEDAAEEKNDNAAEQRSAATHEEADSDDEQSDEEEQAAADEAMAEAQRTSAGDRAVEEQAAVANQGQGQNSGMRRNTGETGDDGDEGSDGGPVDTVIGFDVECADGQVVVSVSGQDLSNIFLYDAEDGTRGSGDTLVEYSSDDQPLPEPEVLEDGTKVYVIDLVDGAVRVSAKAGQTEEFELLDCDTTEGDNNNTDTGDNGSEGSDGDGDEAGNGNETEGDTGSDEGTDVLDEVVVNVPAPTPTLSPATPATPTLTPATPASPAVEMVAERNPTRVLGSQVTRSSQLPRTGDETTNLVPFGLGLVLLGFGLQRTSKRFSAARAS